MNGCFQCLPNCGDCCGVVILKKDLFERNKDMMQMQPTEIVESGDSLVPITDDMLCVFLNRETKQCMIYDERPEVCREYGVSKDLRLQCPYLKPNGNKRSEAKQKQFQRFMRDYQNSAIKQMEART